MSDTTLLIILILLELLALYNLYDTASAMLLHLSSRGYSAQGTIVTLKKAMRRDKARLFVPTNGRLDSYDIGCDYLTDLSYRTDGGEQVTIRDYVIPSIMKLTAGSACPIYTQGQTLPLKCSRRFKKLVVVDLPEPRRRQCSWVWLTLWVLTVIAIGAAIATYPIVSGGAQ